MVWHIMADSRIKMDSCSVPLYSREIFLDQILELH